MTGEELKAQLFGNAEAVISEVQQTQFKPP